MVKPINASIKKFPNMHKFCNGDINKSVLLLRNGVYPYEYMDSRERFDETSLPHEKAFYSALYLEGITDKDYAHAQKVFKELGSKSRWLSRFLCSKQYLFENFRNKCIEIHELDLAHFCLHQD